MHLVYISLQLHFKVIYYHDEQIAYCVTHINMFITEINNVMLWDIVELLYFFFLHVFFPNTPLDQQISQFR